MPQRGQHDELTLEQRLVMQLSAAMHQEEPATDEHHQPQHATRQGEPNRDGVNQSVGTQDEHHTDLGLNATDLSGLLGSIGSALGGYSDPQGHQQPSLSALSGHDNSHPQSTGPALNQTSHQPDFSQNNTAVNVNNTAWLANLLGTNASQTTSTAGLNSQNLSQLSSILSKPHEHQPSHEDDPVTHSMASLESQIAETLRGTTRDLNASHNLDFNRNVTFDGLSAGSIADIMNQLTQPKPSNVPTTSAPADSNTSTSTSRSTSTTRATTDPSAATLNSQSLQTPPSTTSSHQAVGGSTAKEPPSQSRPYSRRLSNSSSLDSANFSSLQSSFPSHQLSTTSIDPEVSSIQSVLHLLLTGGQPGGSTATSEAAVAELPSSSNSLDSAASSQPTTSAAASDSMSNTTPAPGSSTDTDTTRPDFNSLFGLGLGAEDQSLVESLRNAMNMASSSTPTTETPASQTSALHKQRDTPSTSRLNDRYTARVQKPRASPSVRGRSKYSRAVSTDRASTSSAFPSTSGYQGDFNASDPDTLRAIQQALLSSLDPSAASTSLADSLTSSGALGSLTDKGTVPRRSTMGHPLPATGQKGAPSFTKDLKTRDPAAVGQPPHLSSSAAKSASAAAAGTAGAPPSSSSVSSSSSFAGPSSSLLDKHTSDSRLSKQAGKYPLSKISKTTEIDKQKQREENAARKRKWRELNQIHNRDRDLRLRIVKRAHELYGEKDTQDKTNWIEQEFNRRRHRRILRAGIHSIVESARAKALKAQESGGAPGGPHSHIGAGVRTLTQQSRQAASSQLSQLFRSSNAALEPQMHSEKLPVPLAPYMLVASPKRPPYKINRPKLHAAATTNASAVSVNTKNIDNVADKDRESTNTSVHEESSKEASDTSLDDKNENGRKANPTSNSTEVREPTISGEPTDTSKTVSSDEQGMPHVKAANIGSESSRSRADDSVVISSEAQKENDPKEATKESRDKVLSDEDPKSKDSEDKNTKVETDKSTEKGISESDVYTERPKHRYGLVGKIKLGVPPNLTAIYRKIKGFASSQALQQRATSSLSSIEQSPVDHDRHAP